MLPARVPRPSPRPRPQAPTSPSTAPEPEPAPSASGPATVLPVTRERIAQSLRRRGYRFLVDESGDICGLWAYRFFSFYIVRGQMLQVRGRWPRQASIERLWEILAFTNAWNSSRHLPKCYVRVHDDGRVHVLTEVCIPVTSGLSDSQIDHHLAVGLASGAAVFDELDHLFPDPVLSGGPQ